MLILIMNSRSKYGFTLIEVLVVMTALGIIATMLTLNYVNIQKQSRDSKRQASATSLSESLERYFELNGEYPNVSTVTNPNATLVKQTLSIPTINSLLGPSAPAGSNVNAWTTGTANATNQLTYAPNTDTSNSCLTGSAASDVCIDFRLQYYKEETGSIATIYSRNRAIAAAAALVTPSAPTVDAQLNNGDAVATATGSTCNGGSSVEYAFRTRTNDGTWSAYTGWSGEPTARQPVAIGTKYGYQAKAQCARDDQVSGESAPSSEASYTHPIPTPAPPTINQSTAGTTTTFSVNTITCSPGTTAQVQYQLTTDWGYNGAWTAPLSNTGTHVINTANQGYEYVDQAQARCVTAVTASPWSTSSTDSYISPVTTPGGATNYLATMSSGATSLVWSFTRPACHSSVSTGIYYNVYVDNGWTVNGSSGWTGWRHSIITNPATTLTVTLTPTSGPTFTSGGRSAITSEWYCINQTTGRQSSIGPRVQSATYTYNP